MNILLADSDRDLLMSYQKLLTLRGYKVTAAFDGTQVLNLLGQDTFDLVIFEDKLPRTEKDEILRYLKTKMQLSLVLMDSRVTVKDLLAPVLPCAYLPFPFLPEELSALIENIYSRARAQKSISCGMVKIDVSRFCFADTQIPLTAGEMDLLEALETEGKRSAGKRERVLIQALNQKMEALDKKPYIQYKMNQGYRLVSRNE